METMFILFEREERRGTGCISIWAAAEEAGGFAGFELVERLTVLALIPGRAFRLVDAVASDGGGSMGQVQVQGDRGVVKTRRDPAATEIDDVNMRGGAQGGANGGNERQKGRL